MSELLTCLGHGLKEGNFIVSGGPVFKDTEFKIVLRVIDENTVEIDEPSFVDLTFLKFNCIIRYIKLRYYKCVDWIYYKFKGEREKDE